MLINIFGHYKNVSDKALNKNVIDNKFGHITLFTLESWDPRFHSSEHQSEYQVPLASMAVLISTREKVCIVDRAICKPRLSYKGFPAQEQNGNN